MEVGQFVERGHVVFSKKIACGPKIGSDLTVTLKTPLALLVLGGTAGAVKWEQKTIDLALSSLGLFYSDDIAEVIGEELHKKLITHIAVVG